MMRFAFMGGAVLAPFMFPLPFAFFLAFLAGLFSPLVPFFAGVLLDLLYGVPGAGLPVGTLGGLLISLVSFFVRGFFKTRIMWGDA